MAEPRRHPDLFTPDEAAAYLALESDRSLETIRKRWGLSPIAWGKEHVYHRADLDEAVEKARKDGKHTGGRRGRGADTELTLTGAKA